MMRIRELELKNFRRFTDLKIEELPETAKLVLLIGANGSGKSSVFDGFASFRALGLNMDHEYFIKKGIQPYISVEFFSGERLQHFGTENFVQKANELPKFIGRSTTRIVPRMNNYAEIAAISTDQDAPGSSIDPDTRFNNDVAAYMQQINDALRAPVFQGIQADTLQIFRESIQPLNESLLNIFGQNTDTTIQIARFEDPQPNRNGRLIFRKGEVEINYDLLSHGEKQVVILLINFIVRYKYYEDAIIYIDELDTHLNTALQGALLHEIVTRWIPDSAQLWTASHALGFIDYARKSDNAVIIDFDNLDFDQPQVLRPQPKDNLEVYEIAVPKDTIAAILADKKLVVAENKNSALYNLALGAKSYLFLPAHNSREVFLTIKDQPNMLGLRDRDFLRDDEIAAIEARWPNLRILRYYTFENYLYHPDNLAGMDWPGFDRAAYIAEITAQKNARREDIVDKLAEARQTYVEFKEGIKDDKDRTAIRNALASDDFETFYPFFNMKTHYTKAYLAPYPHEPRLLVQTDWFRDRIAAILGA